MNESTLVICEITNLFLEIHKHVYTVISSFFMKYSMHTVTHARTQMPGGHVVIVAGTGNEENSSGKSTHASFSQPMGVCAEMDKNIFVTDIQADTIKLITSIKGTIGFPKHLGLLYKAFSVHLKHQPTAKLSITKVV